jgi:hypothetical protein
MSSRRWPARGRLLVGGWSAVVLASGVGRPALASELAAATPPPATSLGPEQERARALFREGVALLDAARFEEAIERFQRAYDLWKNPKILLNMATTERALGHDATAANLYARYQQSPEADATREAEIAQVLESLDQGLGRLGFANVRGNERLWLDEEELALDVESDLRVAPGEHVLRIERPELSPEVRSMVLAPGERLLVDLGVPSAVAPARPSLNSPDPADEPERAERQLPSGLRTKLRVLARADFDPPRRGAVGAAGAALLVTEYLRVTGGALVGANRGAWLGVEYVPLRGRVAPVFGLSAPTFFVDGVHPGLSAELGLHVVTTRHLTPFVRVAVAHFPNVSERYVPTLIIPSLGLEVGL